MKTAYFYPTIDCLSSEMLQSVTAKDIKVLNQLFILFRITQRNLTIQHAYIQPSERWIRSKTGYSISGISRSITRLTNLGIIKRTHRRKRHGKWQTNLYHLGDQILSMVPWLRKFLKKKGPEPFDQKVKLGDINSLNDGSDNDDLISYHDWKLSLGWKGT